CKTVRQNGYVACLRRNGVLRPRGDEPSCGKRRAVTLLSKEELERGIRGNCDSYDFICAIARGASQNRIGVAVLRCWEMLLADIDRCELRLFWDDQKHRVSLRRTVERDRHVARTASRVIGDDLRPRCRKLRPIGGCRVVEREWSRQYRLRRVRELRHALQR